MIEAPDDALGRPAAAAIVNLGCKVNQSEMEAAARLLRAGGVRLVEPAQPADLVVVNTCTVTAVADEKSRSAVRRARRANADATIIVTGCSVAVDRATFEHLDPGARLVDNEGKAALLAELGALVAIPADDPSLDAPMPTLSGAERIDGAADDRAAVERTRAFVKVQDGCSFHCTYCIIPRARGPERSLAPEVVLGEVRRAVARGHREVVLTGINIGTYDGGWSERGFRGRHERAALTLAGLVGRILAETEVERLRISSIEPQHVDDELLDACAAGAPRTMPHVHLPLQAGDDGILRRMGRRYGTAEYATTVARIRAALPGAAVHADVMTGFPGEDDAAFDRSVAFLRELRLAGLHVFRYSGRPGTPATRMIGQVPEPVKRTRSAALLDLAAALRATRVADRVGERASVLVEARLPDGRWTGHAEDHLPVVIEVDGPAGADLENVLARVRLDSVDPTDGGRALGVVESLEPPSRRLRLALPTLATA